MSHIALDPDVGMAGGLPELLAAERKLRALAAAEGIVYKIAAFGNPIRTDADTTLILGYRDEEYKVYVSRAKAAGKRPVDIGTFRPIQPYGHSFHDYGAAFDTIIVQKPSGMSSSAAVNRLGALGGKAGLVWGGLWSKPDTPHFQLPTGLTQARERWEALHGRGSTTTTPAPTNPLAALLSLGLPGVQSIGSTGGAPTMRATAAAVVQRHPAATATISVGALVAAALLTWVVVRKVTGE